MVHLVEINQVPPAYSMLQYIGRVATPKLVPRNCLRYLQTTLIMVEGGLVSESMSDVLVPGSLSFWLNGSYRWYLLFLIVSLHIFKRIKDHKYIIIGFWLIVLGWYFKTDLDLRSSPPKHANSSQKYCLCLNMLVSQVSLPNDLRFKI